MHSSKSDPEWCYILNGAEIKFRDSLDFHPMPLKALPKTFGLTELKKGFFPHFFNRKETQQYVSPLPPREDYDPDNMSTKERQDFLAWYEERKSADYVFNFEAEIEYCWSDVDILRRCCLEFNKLMEETCNLDPFKHYYNCLRLQSCVSTGIFRRKYNWVDPSTRLSTCSEVFYHGSSVVGMDSPSDGRPHSTCVKWR